MSKLTVPVGPEDHAQGDPAAPCTLVEYGDYQCPYCGERLETRIDLTAEEPSYVEDCGVCCRPIEFHVEREPGGALFALRVRRLD